jgi:hypothetical protein
MENIINGESYRTCEMCGEMLPAYFTRTTRDGAVICDGGCGSWTPHAVNICPRTGLCLDHPAADQSRKRLVSAPPQPACRNVRGCARQTSAKSRRKRVNARN